VTPSRIKIKSKKKKKKGQTAPLIPVGGSVTNLSFMVSHSLGLVKFEKLAQVKFIETLCTNVK
jgi:hypothetical protein